jgi:hypothetical protein
LPSEWIVIAWAVTRHARRVRRVWFIKPMDPRAYGDQDWPYEAARPESIVAGRPSTPMGRPERRP